MMTRKFCLYDRFFVSNRNFTTEYLKLLKFPGFYRLKISLKFKGLLRSPNKVANIMIF